MACNAVETPKQRGGKPAQTDVPVRPQALTARPFWVYDIAGQRPLGNYEAVE